MPYFLTAVRIAAITSKYVKQKLMEIHSRKFFNSLGRKKEQDQRI